MGDSHLKMVFATLVLCVILLRSTVVVAQAPTEPSLAASLGGTLAPTQAPGLGGTVVGDAAGGGSKAEYVDPQNKARAAVGVGPLTWNDTVAAYALDYCKQRANDCDLIHSHGPYGENLCQASYDPKPGEVVKWWVDDEKPFFDYNNNKCAGGDCGHYTQAVSNTSFMVGCAKVKCNGDKGFFISCNYSPPGNYIGVKPY